MRSLNIASASIFALSLVSVPAVAAVPDSSTPKVFRFKLQEQGDLSPKLLDLLGKRGVGEAKMMVTQWQECLRLRALQKHEECRLLV